MKAKQSERRRVDRRFGATRPLEVGDPVTIRGSNRYSDYAGNMEIEGVLLEEGGDGWWLVQHTHSRATDSWVYWRNLKQFDRRHHLRREADRDREATW